MSWHRTHCCLCPAPLPPVRKMASACDDCAVVYANIGLAHAGDGHKGNTPPVAGQAERVQLYCERVAAGLDATPGRRPRERHT